MNPVHLYMLGRGNALGGGDQQLGIRLGSGQTQDAGAPTSVPRRESNADVGQQAALVASAGSYPVGERQGLAERAPQGLNGDSQELWNLAWDFLSHATIGIEEAGAAAQACLRLLETQSGKTRFLRRLYKCCVTVFENRQCLLPDMEPTQAPQRWTAYVFFIEELVLGLGRRYHVASGAASSTTTKEEAIARRLARLLCQCGLIVLRAPCMGHPTEVECLRTVITTCGGTMERLAPEAMTALTGRLRRAVEERPSDNIRPILRDILTQANV